MANVSSETRLVAKHSTVYAAGNLLRRIGALLLLPLYTSYLTPEDYGVKELIALTVDIASILLATSVSSGIFRFYFDSDDPKRRDLVMSTSILTLGCFGTVTLGILWPLTGPLAGLILDDVGLAHLLLMGFGTLWFQTVNHVAFAYMRAHQKSVQFVAASMAAFLLTIGMNVYFIVSLGLGVFGILLSTLLTSAVMFLVLTIPLVVRIGPRFDRKILVEILAFGWPNAISSLASLVVKMADRFFLKAYAGIAEAGIYSLGARFAAVPNQFISVPFNQSWMPRRFEIAKQPDSERVFGRIFTYYLAVIAFAGLIVSVLTTDLIKLMSDSKFWSAAGVVPVLVLANIVFTFHYHFNIGLLLEKKTKYIAVVNLVNVVLVLALYWWLIPIYGSMGAAFSSLLAFAFKAIMTFVLGRRFYKTHFEGWRALQLLAVSAVVYFGARAIVMPTPAISLVVKGAVVAISYPGLLLVLRFFTRDERRQAIQMVRGRIPWLRNRAS